MELLNGKFAIDTKGFNNRTRETIPEGEFKRCELLGEGSYGKVFRAIQRSTNQS